MNKQNYMTSVYHEKSSIKKGDRTIDINEQIFIK